MNAQKVLMVGFNKKGYLMVNPLVCRIFGVHSCDFVETEDMLFTYEQAVEALFISTFYLGLDFKRRIQKIRDLLGGIRIICYAAHTIDHRIGVYMAKTGIDVLYANIEDDHEYEKAVYAIRNNQRFFPKNVREALLSDYVVEPVRFLQLSRKEREWLNLTVRGLSVKEIADEMHVTNGTVSSMRKNTLRKMGVRTTHELLHLVHMYNYIPSKEF